MRVIYLYLDKAPKKDEKASKKLEQLKKEDYEFFIRTIDDIEENIYFETANLHK
jgi:hypothetical protein